jgi:hypothetical protein
MNRTNLNDRLARHLDDAAAATRLRPGSTTGVVRAARRRSARRRQLTAAASVVAIGGVTVVGVQELSSTSGPEITTGDPASRPDAAAPAPAPADPRPGAVAVEPQLTWRAVQPDSAAAVGSSVGEASWVGPRFPGVLVSTSPAGTDEEGLFRLWRSEDGVTFSQTGTSPPIGSLLNGAVIGSHVYAFGTAPGVAATEPNPLLASISVDGGTTWDQVTLPVDTNRLRNLPGVNSVGTQGTVARTEAGTLIAVTTYAGTDLQDLVPGTPLLSFGTNGAEVAANGDCAPSSAETATTPPVVPGTEPSSGERPDGCVTEFRTWEELGVDAELAAAATGGLSTLLHAADGRTFTELVSPTGAPVVSLYLPSTTEPIVVTRDGADSRLWRLDPDLTWVELPMPFGDIYTVLQVNNRLTAIHANGDPNERLLAVSTFDGATWHTVDVGALADGATEVHAIGVGDAGIALVVLVAPTPATTDTVPEATTTIVSPAASDDGSETATDSTVLGRTGSEEPDWYVLHSTDAVNWSVEDLRDLLGPDAIGLPFVQRIGSTGNQLMITVSMRTPNSTTPPTQIVLVGTPKG